MSRWCAGATTGLARLMRRRVRLLRSPPEGAFSPAAPIRVGCGLMGRWCAGVTTGLARLMRLQGSFIQVSSGRHAHSCGLRSDGSVVCWGDNRLGQADAPSGSFTQVSSGRHHSCGLRSDESVVCWGDNRLGQADAPSGSFTQVSVGGSYSCGLRSDGSVVCWGNNSEGQADAPSGSFTQVSSSEYGSCGLRSDGWAVCWGTPAVVLAAGRDAGVSDGGDGSVSGESAGGSEPVPGLPGRVEGVGVEVIEFGRNLFWRPLVGVSGYEIDAREAGGDRADYRGDIGCGETWERCGYLFERDRQTSDAFRGASEFRVRGVNEAGAGSWSVWVSAGEAVPGVEGLAYRRSGSGLVLFWDRLAGAWGYDVEARDAFRAALLRAERCGARVCEYVVDEDWNVDGDFRSASDYRVRAVVEEKPSRQPGGSFERGPWSEWVSVEVSGEPRAVRNLRYGVGSLDENGFRVSMDRVGWDPVRGADSYELEYEYPGEPARKVRNLAEQAERYECSRKRCSYRFLRIPQRTVKVRVRAINQDGAGEWSNWVPSVRRPAKAPAITRLVPLPGFGADDVVVHWDVVAGAKGYKIEWRYLDFGDGLAGRISATNNVERLQAVSDAMADESNYRVVSPGSGTVGLVSSFQVGSVIDNDEDENYLLEFRVTALGDKTEDDKASNWVKWSSQKLKNKLRVTKCGTLTAISLVDKHGLWSPWS